MRSRLLLSGLLALSASGSFAQPVSSPPVPATTPTSASRPLETKDFATLTLSLVALLISVVNVLHTVKSKRQDTERSARSDFADIVESLVDLRQTRDTLRRELASDGGKYKTFETRAALGDKQKLLVSRAVFLLRNYHIDVSDMQYTIIGASLADDGQYGESLQYYEKAVEVSPSPLARNVSASCLWLGFDTGRRRRARSGRNALCGR
jgi:hypothetical protein